jgi:hypothetical protein
MKEPKETSISYFLWLACLVGVPGLHRIYLGRYLSGIFYIVTGGGFMVGQLLDLALIPGMVEEENIKYRALQGGVAYDAWAPAAPAATMVQPLPPARLPIKESIEQSILRLCVERGEITLSECVVATGADIGTVKTALRRLMYDNLVQIDNRDSDGSVICKAL